MATTSGTATNGIVVVGGGGAVVDVAGELAVEVAIGAVVLGMLAVADDGEVWGAEARPAAYEPPAINRRIKAPTTVRRTKRTVVNAEAARSATDIAALGHQSRRRERVRTPPGA
ncbi:MAG: hypothetical protein ACYCYQ_00525 [Acidimicrobiales bacterium]